MGAELDFGVDKATGGHGFADREELVLPGA